MFLKNKGTKMKNSTIFTVLMSLTLLAFVSTISTVRASDLDLSSLTQGATLGSGITKQQLPSIIKSEKVYCVKVQGKNYLASSGAMKVFRKTVTSRTKSVVCNDKVVRQAISEGVEVIQLSKAKMTPEAYATIAQAMTRAFGI